MERTFESAMARLEEISVQLENGGSSLEESMELFEEGTHLIRYCNEQLTTAEQKIERLTEAGGES